MAVKSQILPILQLDKEIEEIQSTKTVYSSKLAESVGTVLKTLRASSGAIAYVNLTAAEMGSLNTNPIVIIPSQGPNVAIVATNIVLEYNFVSTAYTDWNTGKLAHTGGNSINQFGSFINNTAADISDNQTAGFTSTIIYDEGVQLETDADDTSGGGSLEMWVYYYLLDLADLRTLPQVN